MTTRGKKILLVGLVVVVIAAFKLSGIQGHLTLANLRSQGEDLRKTVADHYVLSVLVYVVGYAAAVTLYVPGDIVLSLAGGYLFGTFLGALYINVGATAGALLSFLFARYMAGEWLQDRYSRHLDRFNREIEARGSLYLLIVRLIPLFPFVLVNLLSGFTRVPLKTFVWTTAVGIIPVSIIYTFAGGRLGTITSARDLFTLPILAVLVLLIAALAVPLVIKKLNSKPDL